jgi:hypothetical protein
MCPDRQILSVYLDPELPEPWNTQMEDHLKTCGACQAALERYRRLSVFTGGQNPEKAFPPETIRERVWQSLSAGTALSQGQSPRQHLGQHPPQKIWRRSVSIPLPAAAAAAAIFMAAFTFALINLPGMKIPLSGESAMAAGTAADPGSDFRSSIPISDMQGVLQYLGQENSGDSVIIYLPEARSFSSAGEPTIIKAADYSRGNPPR